jgi:hypothetical protein
MRRPPSAVSESSSFCLFIKTDGKSWSFRLRRWRILQLTHGNLGRGEAPAVAASRRSIGGYLHSCGSCAGDTRLGD